LRHKRVETWGWNDGDDPRMRSLNRNRVGLLVKRRCSFDPIVLCQGYGSKDLEAADAKDGIVRNQNFENCTMAS
jgi:hypothetical protein